MEPFAQTINGAKKYVVSNTLERVDWNSELLRGDLGNAVQRLKQESGKGLLVGGVMLPLALTELGLIDEYEFVVHPRIAGHGPTLFAGLSRLVDLRLVGREELGSGAVALRYDGARPQSGAPITAGERQVGTMGSAADGRGIALIRLDRVAETEASAVAAGGIPIRLIKPDWARFAFPVASKAAE